MQYPSMAMALFDEGRKRRMRDALAKGEAIVFRKGAAEGPMPDILVVHPLSPEEKTALDCQLISAAESGDYHKAKDALDRGADPNSRDAGGTPAIMVAGNSYNERSGWAVMHDINNGMKVVNDPRNLDGINMTAGLLLERGADPDALDARGRRVTDITPYEMPCTCRLTGNKP